ncbi:MAG: hypothetical protein KDD38_02190, partial [Bdellovibrionales bacterium]|nr:hypothetical protein [Bdellovibrionales bacterium]
MFTRNIKFTFSKLDGLIYAFVILTSFSGWADAELSSATQDQNISPNQPSTNQQHKGQWTNFLPYAPEKNEYQFELGGMWEADNLYWLGLTYGRHMGRCV